MPLPKTAVDIHFLDKDSKIKEGTFTRKETGYKADKEYYPTMRLVKCSKCGEVGACEFLGGMNLKEGDRLMDGKPIRGTCLKCNKTTDLVPLPVDKQNPKDMQLYYQIQEALKEAVARGESLGSTGMIWPLERVREWERHVNGQQPGR